MPMSGREHVMRHATVNMHFSHHVLTLLKSTSTNELSEAAGWIRVYIWDRCINSFHWICCSDKHQVASVRLSVFVFRALNVAAVVRSHRIAHSSHICHFKCQLNAKPQCSLRRMRLIIRNLEGFKVLHPLYGRRSKTVIDQERQAVHRLPVSSVIKSLCVCVVSLEEMKWGGL